jgi:hypothetical protein
MYVDREEMKHVLFENLDLIQSRIDKSMKPLSERIAKIEKNIEEINERMDEYNE